MFRDAPPVGSCSRTGGSAPFTLGREAPILSQVLDQLELWSGVRAFGRPWGIPHSWESWVSGALR